MFAENHAYVTPWDVKQIIAMKAVQFAGFSQHDSQEMLSFLLENLHEDVNKVAKKPYVEYKDSANRADSDISKEFWDGFLKREQSLLVDLFYGQLKSRVQCTQCEHVSLTFDPFNMLSLPIPTSKNLSFFVKFVPYELNQDHIEFQLSVGEFVTVSELKQKVNDFLKKWRP